MAAPDYSSAQYWEFRYNSSLKEQHEAFDWYLSHEELALFYSKYQSRAKADDFELLIIGCGTSTMPADLYSAGCRNISAIDISPSAIAIQSSMYENLPDVDFSCIDACDMSDAIPESCFDCVIEKATGDSLLCGSSDGPGGDMVRRGRFAALISEAARVLKPGGWFLSISQLPPELRLPLLIDAPQTSLSDRLWQSAPEVTPLPKPQSQLRLPGDPGKQVCYYLYACQRALQGSRPR